MVTHQFDVFKNPRDREAFPLLLVVQHGLLSELPLRVVVPLTKRRQLSGAPITRLNPILRVDGSDWVMLTQMLGAVREASLRVRVGNVAGKRAEIVAALDVLWSGV